MPDGSALLQAAHGAGDALALARERFALRDRPADDYFASHSHADDRTFLLADGTAGAVIHMHGKPLALLDMPARRAERRKRHAVLRALAGRGIAVYEHLVCHDRVESFAGAPCRPGGYPEALARDYHRSLQAGMLARDWFVTVMAKPGRAAGWLAGLRGADP